jgi:hypothetical protein
MQQSKTDSAAEKTIPVTPGAIGNDDDLAGHIKVVVVDKETQRSVDMLISQLCNTICQFWPK